MTSRFYITTSIPYVNGKPHIGFALEIVFTDAVARYQRLTGNDTWFLTGTDDNALSNVRAAEREGIPVRELVDRNATAFMALKDALALSHDDFIRTSSDSRHAPGATKLWKACDAAGDIYRKPYRGLYCVECERFYKEDELQDGLCPLHFTRPELVEEENYFFRLSKYASRLIELIESGELQIVPEFRKNEVLSFIGSGLEDLSISRTVARARGWGVPVPGDPEHVMYVWFDALSNYITALGYASEDDLFRRYWLDNPARVHVIGKDIIRFHAVYWPAILLSAGVPVPRTIFVHGHIRIGGKRMSTTIGNVVDPFSLVEEFGTDAVRYFILKLPATQDPDFTLERFVSTYNHDLADQLGNLLSRTVAMVSSYCNGRIPEPDVAGEAEQRLVEVAATTAASFDRALSEWAVHEALGAVWDLISAANKYAVEVAPWSLERDDLRVRTALFHLVEALRLAAVLCAPLLPGTSNEVLRRIGAPPIQNWKGEREWGLTKPGASISEGPSLFPKKRRD